MRFPKIFGFKLNEKYGEYAAYCWNLGFLLAFIPLYILGLMGATRRLDHYDAASGWRPLFIIAAVGVAVIFVGIAFQALQIWVSIKQRKQNRDTTGDPWNGRTLEWSTASPPPFYNFARIPDVTTRDAFWTMKQSKQLEKEPYEDIHMPKNTPLGLFIGLLSFTFAFAIIWFIWWLAIASLIGIVAAIIARLFETHTEVTITAAQLETMEAAR